MILGLLYPCVNDARPVTAHFRVLTDDPWNLQHTSVSSCVGETTRHDTTSTPGVSPAAT